MAATEISNFSGVWWRISLPPGWSARQDEECVTFQGDPPIGALQISSARKSEGVVTDEDLMEFGASKKAHLSPATHDRFSGFCAEYCKDGRSWNEWWLRCGDLLVYVTYNVELGSEEAERNAVTKIVASLKPASNV
jgi:hypothetical protein